ncbi:MAG TPA: hypothetical protein PK513_04990 [Alphaproteobacteria bacterium]|nr:hypothetical protein [Alphaproteobacteria bacterium]USO05661.1 MAG: hypothetical protein H6859_00175 [Rhodospirillales bacterium]HOO81835.1 hypothetical protein [Alphaproteobacteria bacterium]
MGDTKYTALGRTNTRIIEQGIMPAEKFQKNKYSPKADYPKDVTDQFNTKALPLDHIEETFLRLYERQKLFADNNTAYTSPQRITATMMEELDDRGPEGRHPAIEAAFQDIMSRPDKFGLEVKEAGMFNFGGPHNFTPIVPQ